MQELYKLFCSFTKVKDLFSFLKTNKQQQDIRICNFSGAVPLLLLGIFEIVKKNLIYIDTNKEAIFSYYETLNSLISSDKLFIIKENIRPEKDWYQNSSSLKIFLLSEDELNFKLLKQEYWNRCQIKISREQEVKKENLIRWLTDTNYEKVNIVSEPGEYAVRGSIIDIYPPDLNLPVRIEFADNKVVSLRYFDSVSQKSVTLINEIEIFLNTLNKPVHVSLKELLPRDTVLVMATTKLNSIFNFFDSPNSRRIFLEQNPSSDKPTFDLDLEKPFHYYGNLKLLKSEIDSSTIKYLIVLPTQSQYERTSYFLGEKPIYIIGELKCGFMSRCEGVCVLTDEELFGKHLQKLRPRKFRGQPIDDLLGIRKGDFVVHIDYGIGQFEGIKRLKVQNLEKDFIEIKYAKNQKLYLPVENINLIERYIGTTDEPPALSVLGSSRWLTAKRKAAEAQEKYLKELLTLYAHRTLARKSPLPKDDEWSMLVALSFPYEETKDQLAVLEEVYSDLESAYPMERLLCGDNGFGKTEIALRAAVKVLSGLKQVAVLVPNTILAYQHYNTFRTRLKDLPVRVEMLSRLTPKSKVHEIIEGLKTGKVDVIIGTHSLLKPEIEFYDLGLLIIDEEHKFGVLQKEQIKKLKSNIDVLMLSATPIPRSLYRALIGIANISILNTPPAGRRDIITQVIYWDDDFILEKINYELNRGGQVFFIHNEIKSLDSIYNHLKSINPKWRIRIAHSKLSEKILAETYLDFLAQKYDILLSTAIVETGLDIPNANTIFVNRAETFGLAELHQLRGRVGRGSRQAYAYFIVSEHKNITTESSTQELYRKRLSALIAYSSLGAGFRLALRDMEIRGVGNLLGVEQHGHINKIGFSLYRKMLQETIARLRGQKVSPEPVLSLDIPAHIPEDYISDNFSRMAIYKRLLSVEHHSEIEALKEELIDRYGKIPQVVENLFLIAKIRLFAKEAGVEKITCRPDEIDIYWQGKKFTTKGNWETLITTLKNLKISN
ncbi:MAG: transcription-repair coupling factor [candidate division WOR-3 bacterium]|nr:transcription-repair coupling factor [candidate division WOR-3 bacterium]